MRFPAIWRTGAWARAKPSYDSGLWRQRLGRGEKGRGGGPKYGEVCLPSFLREASPFFVPYFSIIDRVTQERSMNNGFGFAGIHFPLYLYFEVCRYWHTHGSMLAVLRAPRCQSRHRGNQCLQSRTYSSALSVTYDEKCCTCVPGTNIKGQQQPLSGEKEGYHNTVGRFFSASSNHHFLCLCFSRTPGGHPKREGPVDDAAVRSAHGGGRESSVVAVTCQKAQARRQQHGSTQDAGYPHGGGGGALAKGGGKRRGYNQAQREK